MDSTPLISLPRDNKSGGQRGVTLSGSALMENSGASVVGGGGVGDYCVQRQSAIRNRGSGAAACRLHVKHSRPTAPPDSSYTRICLVLCVRFDEMRMRRHINVIRPLKYDGAFRQTLQCI